MFSPRRAMISAAREFTAAPSRAFTAAACPFGDVVTRMSRKGGVSFERRRRIVCLPVRLFTPPVYFGGVGEERTSGYRQRKHGPTDRWRGMLGGRMSTTGLTAPRERRPLPHPGPVDTRGGHDEFRRPIQGKPTAAVASSRPKRPKFTQMSPHSAVGPVKGRRQFGHCSAISYQPQHPGRQFSEGPPSGRILAEIVVVGGRRNGPKRSTGRDT